MIWGYVALGAACVFAWWVMDGCGYDPAHGRTVEPLMAPCEGGCGTWLEIYDRRLTPYLCVPCFKVWRVNPAARTVGECV